MDRLIGLERSDCIVNHWLFLLVAAFVLVFAGKDATKVMHVEESQEQSRAILKHTPVVKIMISAAPVRVDVLPLSSLMNIVYLSE